MTQNKRLGWLTTVGLIAAVLTVRNIVTLCVLLQDAGSTSALIPDLRAGGFCQSVFTFLEVKRREKINNCTENANLEYS